MSTLSKRTLCNIMLLAATLLPAQTLCAAENAENFYVGLGVGVVQVTEDVFLVDDSGAAYKAMLGYEFNENVRFEASFVALDDYEAFNPFVVDSQRAVANGRGLNVAAVLRMPLADRLELSARIGMLFWNSDSDSASNESSGNDMSFGLGASFDVNDALGIRLDFDALNFGDVDANVVSAALEYRF